MKNQRKPENNCEEENLQLLGALESYNEYITGKLATIEEFDIWYETAFSKDFPKCWYTTIRTGKL